MQEDCLATIVFSSDRRMVAEKETIALSAITQLLSRGVLNQPDPESSDVIGVRAKCSSCWRC